MAKICPKCGKPLDARGYCAPCSMTVTVYQKIQEQSKMFYNQGLQKAKVRDLSGAIDLLNRSIRCDKANIDARNLLGLIYFEIGQTVSALQQWVVSKNIKGTDNPAIQLIDKIQNNQSYLDKLNSAIKKYNQAIVYIDQKSVDLAIIQLKKVVSLNPNFVKAHCLLALCYVKEQQADKAKKQLLKVIRIDQSNYIARKYMDELNADTLNSSDFVEDKVKETRSFGGTPFMNTAKLGLSNAMIQFLTVCVGVAIGLAVMAFLIMPSSVKDEERLRITAESKVIVLEDSKSALELQVSQLESTLDDTKNSNSKLSNDYKYSQLQLQEVSKMVRALDFYMANDLNETANSLELVDPTLLNEESLRIYTDLTTELYPEVASKAWKQGYNDYRNGKYESGIVNLELAYKFEPNADYSDETLYYLGRCYYKLDNPEKALTIFEKLLELFPEANNKKDAEYYVKVIKGN